ISFTQGLAEELGPMNIAVNALCPGYIKTAMWTEVLNPVLSSMLDVPVDRVFEDFVQRSTFLRREQTPEEIADAAVYLCRAENVTAGPSWIAITIGSPSPSALATHRNAVTAMATSTRRGTPARPRKPRPHRKTPISASTASPHVTPGVDGGSPSARVWSA